MIGEVSEFLERLRASTIKMPSDELLLKGAIEGIAQIERGEYHTWEEVLVSVEQAAERGREKRKARLGC